jgi:hypothetical protein
MTPRNEGSKRGRYSSIPSSRMRRVKVPPGLARLDRLSRSKSSVIRLPACAAPRDSEAHQWADVDRSLAASPPTTLRAIERTSSSLRNAPRQTVSAHAASAMTSRSACLITSWRRVGIERREATFDRPTTNGEGGRKTVLRRNTPRPANVSVGKRRGRTSGENLLDPVESRRFRMPLLLTGRQAWLLAEFTSRSRARE